MTEYFTVERNPELIDRKVIEDIKAEIRHNADREIGGNSQDFVSGYRCGMGEALEIINKHISEKGKRTTVLKADTTYRNAYTGVCPNCKVDVISGHEIVDCWNCGMNLKLEKYRGDEE